MSSRNDDFSDLSDLDDISRDEDAGIEGDDLDELIEQDYRPIPHLDRYDSDVDNDDYDAMSLQNRRNVETELDARDGRNREMDLLPPPPSSPHIPDSDHIMSEPASNPISQAHSDRFAYDDGFSDDDQDFVNLDDFSGPLREWIALDRPRREIRRRFRAVLTDYEDKNGENYYGPRIASMCADFKQSLLVSYCHISTTAPTLGIWLADCPKEMLELFDDEATAVVFSLFPEYGSVHDRIFVRITDLPVADNIRDLRQVHLNALVRVSGVVTRRTAVYPQLLKIKYDCGKCPLILGPFVVNSTSTDDDTIHRPSRCPGCESTGPFVVNQSETVYRNYQRITLQESPGSVPAGRVPRTKDVVLLNDLRDCARPGEEIDITGIYMNNFSISLNTQHGFPVFATMIEANYIFKRNDQYANQSLTQEDREMIQVMARQPDIGSRIVASIAPAIYGHDDIRIALAMALFGGCCKQSPNAHRIRGDINVLMLGDPGTAKSQFLKYIERTSPRAVFTTGKGASAVGLTACVHRDPVSKEWTLEGGALVLADSGHCLIDEFDKMNDKDRTSLHEAMEQQSISISKAGIITTLQARCSILAAANPLKGRYDSSLTFLENVELTDPILSRFDILCVVRDTVDPVVDEKLAFHVVDSHIKSHPDNHSANVDEQEAPFDPLLSPIIPQNLLRKYIQYARQCCKPSLVNIDADKVSKLYIDLRQQSATAGGIPVAVRHVESILRMAEAHAKMHLRDQVRHDDIDMAIRVMLSSFIGAQKLAVMKHLKGKFQKYMLYKRSHEELLFFLLKQMIQDETYRQDLTRSVDEHEGNEYRSEEDSGDEGSVDKTSATMKVMVPITELESRARELDIHNIGPFFEGVLFRSNRFSIEGDMIIRSF